MIRTIRPTDLVALALLNSKAFPNEALVYDHLGKPATPLSLTSLVRRSLPLNDHTWVYTQGATIEGMVSVRNRRGPTVWEINHLLATTAVVGATLLASLTEQGAKAGVEKIFLRLTQDNLLREEAKKVGFSPYHSEYLYQGEGRQEEPPALPYPPRPQTKADEWELFRLYNTAVPPAVRYAEGMTLAEWRQSQERGKLGFVCEKEGRLIAELKVAASGSRGLFEVLVHPKEEATMVLLVEYCRWRLREKPLLFCLAPDFTPSLGHLLAAQGFSPVAEYSVLVKPVAKRERQSQPLLLPVPSLRAANGLLSRGDYAPPD